MLEQLKTDRLIHAMLAGIVLVGCFGCAVWGAWLYRILAPASPAPAQQAAAPPPAQAPPPAAPTQPPPTATPKPTATTIPLALPTASEEQEKANWGRVDIRDLAKNPDRYEGQQVHFRGKVFTIEEDDQGSYMQVKVPIPGGSEFDTEFVVVVFRGTTDGIYEDTEVEFWGVSRGAFEGKNAFGGDIRQPLILAEHLTYFN